MTNEKTANKGGRTQRKNENQKQRTANFSYPASAAAVVFDVQLSAQSR